VSVRYDDNDRFGSKTTYRIAPEFVITETGTTLKGSVGSGLQSADAQSAVRELSGLRFFRESRI
jgi:vitamin B12 transporter